MKSVLRSAKPYYVYLILKGIKKVELGKDFPTSPDWDKTVELYCSKDKKSFNRIPQEDREWMRKYLGKVACRFVCDRVERIDYKNKYLNGSISITAMKIFAEKINSICLTLEELNAYGAGKSLYGWHISDLKIYDKPKELGELKAWRWECETNEKQFKYCRFGYAHKSHCEFCKWIRRPPQSWQYCEVS